MNTKKAIEFVKQMANAFKCIGDYKCSDIDKKQNEIISLLQRSEKCKSDFDNLVSRWDKLYEENKINKRYRQMWGELYFEYGMCPIRKNDEEGYMSNILYKILEELQQKHFPKEAKK